MFKHKSITGTGLSVRGTGTVSVQSITAMVIKKIVIAID
jgi:hypothetical protein